VDEIPILLFSGFHSTDSIEKMSIKKYNEEGKKSKKFKGVSE